jgi:hypothetical protein
MRKLAYSHNAAPRLDELDQLPLLALFSRLCKASVYPHGFVAEPARQITSGLHGFAGDDLSVRIARYLTD